MAHHRLPVRFRNKESNTPNSPAEIAPTVVSRELNACPKPNNPDRAKAAGQKPIPDASAFCRYPRNKNSSNSPASRKASAHAATDDTIAVPCRARPVMWKQPSRYITSNVPLIIENPIATPRPKFFTVARDRGSPYSPNFRPSIFAITNVARQTTRNATISDSPISKGVMVILAAAFCCSRNPCTPPARIKTKLPNEVQAMARNISTRQPERRPCEPTKTDFTIDERRESAVEAPRSGTTF